MEDALAKCYNPMSRWRVKKAEQDIEMGNFYVNHVAFNASGDAVIAELRREKRHGFCSNTIDKNVYVYDQESDSQNSNVIVDLGKSLSSAFECGVMAVLNHDDDILAIWSFESGRLRDTYNSTPNYFGEQGEVQGGNANTIARVANAVANETAVEEVLRDQYAFAFQRHWALAKTLHLEPNHCICGATSIEHGDIPPTLDSIERI